MDLSYRRGKAGEEAEEKGEEKVFCFFNVLLLIHKFCT